MIFPTRLSQDDRLVRLTLVALLSVLAILRIQDFIIHPQFWAEDGMVFFHDAYCFGAHSLTKTYSGYYHLVPRLIALFTTLFNPRYAPIIYGSISMILMSLVIYLILSPRLSLPFKPLLALFIVAIPNSELELYANITNIQWHLAIGIFVLLLIKPSTSRLYLILECIFVLFASLSGPFVLLLLPLFAFVTFRSWSKPQEKRRMMCLMIPAIVAASIQAVVLSINGLNLPGNVPASTTSLREMFLLILNALFLHMYSLYVIGIGHYFPSAFTEMTFLTITIVASILTILTLIIVIYSLVKRDYEFEKIMICYFGLIILFASLYRSRANLFTLLNNQSENRYFFIPNVMLCWLFVLMLKDKLLKSITGPLIALLLFSTIVYFTREPFVDYNWPFWADKIGTVSQLNIPINPPGWTIDMRCHAD